MEEERVCDTPPASAEIINQVRFWRVERVSRPKSNTRKTEEFTPSRKVPPGLSTPAGELVWDPRPRPSR